jgi:hypothetical protein
MLNWGFGFYRTNIQPPDKAGERVPIQCRHCFTHTDAQVIASFATPHGEWHPTPADMPIHNLLLRCTRCQGAMLFLWPYAKEPTGGGITTEGRLFPVGSARNVEPGFKSAVPAAILEDLQQAEMCESVGAIYGAALLYRRAVQYLCRDKKVPDSGGLKGQISYLANNGIITSSLKELAEHVRIIGNDIAHPDAQHPARIEWNDIKAVSEFTTQIIDAVYVAPYKAAELRKTLKRKGVPGA